MNAFHRQARDALGQGVAAGEHAGADGRRVQRKQFARVGAAIPHDDFVFIARMGGQRPHQGQATALGREHAGYVQEGLAQRRCQLHPHFVGHAVLLVQREAKIKQFRLLLADQARQRDGGAHVRQRIVRRFMQQAIGRAQVFQAETRASIFLARPHDALRAQRVRHAHHVQDVPAPALVLPFARVGIDQIAPEQEARDFIIETYRVVADPDRARLGKRLLDGGGELVLRHPRFQALLRGNAGNQARLRIGQEIRRRLAIQHDRFADFIECGVGADRRELGRTVAARLHAKGFVIVPEKG